MIAGPWLPSRAQRSPDRTAVLWDGGALDHAALELEARGAAAILRERGVAPGDRVALLCENGPDFLAWVHAIDRVGAVLLPLNWRLTPRELAFQLGRAAPSAWVADETHASRGEEAAALASLAAGIEAKARGGSQAPPPAERADDDPFALLFTSGTTGRPKGAVFTRGAFLASAVASAFGLGVDPADRWLACMPLFHVGGLSIVWRSVLQGTAIQIHPRFDPERVSRALDDEGTTLVSLTATMLDRLLRVRAGRSSPPSLRVVLLGGGPCPAPLLEEARALGFPVAPTYGLTEACSQVATRDPHGPSDAGLAPLLGTEVRIAGDDGALLAAGEIGEIQVRGPSVMRGYLDDPEATARTLRDGWLHTGDLGRLDDRGGLHVVDRRSDLIVSGGENVYPAEIEAALIEHPGVAEVAVAGVADAEFGRRPAAWWVAGAERAPDEAGLRAFCRERLAGYKVPVAFHRVDALPRDGAGKLLRRELR